MSPSQSPARLPAEDDAAGEDAAGTGGAGHEQALIARCLSGEGGAFQSLVQRYQSLALSIASRMLGNKADAEDVSQQAFADAYRALDRFSAEGPNRSFSAWLLRIVVNRSKDLVKSKKWSEEPLDGDVGSGDAAFAQPPDSPEANVSRGEDIARLEAALLRVPPQFRDVLILKDIDELPYEEIRAILGLPLTTLKIRVVRARRILRTMLGEGAK